MNHTAAVPASGLDAAARVFLESEPMTPIMRYKLRHGLTYPLLAERLGIKLGHARKLGAGILLRTSPELAEQIEKRSGGEIRKEEMVFPKDARKRRKN